MTGLREASSTSREKSDSGVVGTNPIGRFLSVRTDRPDETRRGKYDNFTFDLNAPARSVKS